MEGKTGIADVFLGFCRAILLDSVNDLKGSYRGYAWTLIAKSPLGFDQNSVLLCCIL
jgi:hypothetical protein